MDNIKYNIYLDVIDFYFLNSSFCSIYSVNFYYEINLLKSFFLKNYINNFLFFFINIKDFNNYVIPYSEFYFYGYNYNLNTDLLFYNTEFQKINMLKKYNEYNLWVNYSFYFNDHYQPFKFRGHGKLMIHKIPRIVKKLELNHYKNVYGFKSIFFPRGVNWKLSDFLNVSLFKIKYFFFFRKDDNKIVDSYFLHNKYAYFMNVDFLKKRDFSFFIFNDFIFNNLFIELNRKWQESEEVIYLADYFHLYDKFRISNDFSNIYNLNQHLFSGHRYGLNFFKFSNSFTEIFYKDFFFSTKIFYLHDSLASDQFLNRVCYMINATYQDTVSLYIINK
jgi:hypothetical protein